MQQIDAALLERLRANPGLHLPLDPDYTLAVPLALEEDSFNRSLFGTEVDLREPVDRRSIHIQRKGGLTAIHADDYNPKAGVVSWVLHQTLEVPVVPLLAGLLLGAALLVLGRWSTGNPRTKVPHR